VIPVKQTGDDCWAACVASILELPLEEVPRFRLGDDWLPEWQDFLLKRNLSYIGWSIDITWKNVPPGWSILLCRTTEDNAENAELDWQRHAIVCRNGRPVWDPNGYRLPDSWDGYIRSRSWQIVDPIGWTVFTTLDPTLALNFQKPEDVHPFGQLVAESSELLKSLRQRTRSYRLGIESFRFFSYSDRVITAYLDAQGDEEGEQAAIKALRWIKQECLNQSHIKEEANGRESDAPGGQDVHA